MRLPAFVIVALADFAVKPRRWWIGIVCCLSFCVAVSPAALALDRPLPAQGLLAIWQASSLPQIVIDGQNVLLSAGAQIRDQKNLIVQISAVPAVDVPILYLANRQGQIERIWILTDAEVEQIRHRAAASPVSFNDLNQSTTIN